MGPAQSSGKARTATNTVSDGGRHGASTIQSRGQGVQGYYQDPSQRGDILVFASEGDLWRAPAQGGSAARLTSSVEEVSDATLSPDGRLVAFTARHAGLAQVHVMPVDGGPAQQLTFDANAFTRGWTPDGHVLFANDARQAPLPARLSLVDPDSGAITAVPFDGATNAAIAPDGTFYITRFGLSQFNDNAVLYRGGLMAQLWRYKAGQMEEAERLIPDFDGPIHHPMWWHGRIAFISDQSGADNIWSVDPQTGDLHQHSHFTGWELRGACIDRDQIVYQRGADLFRFNLLTSDERQIPLTLISSREQCRARFVWAGNNRTESIHLGPDADRVTTTVRGRAAIVFTGERRRIELDVPPGARARDAVISADGKWVFVILDQDRFGEIWRYPADGRGEAEQITRDSDAHIWTLHPSPDGQYLLFHDKKARLWSLDLESFARTLLETGESGFYWAFEDFTWSSGGRYLAYTIWDKRFVDRVVLRDLEANRREIVTTAKFNSYSPVFSPDGHWLYFISKRHYEAANPFVHSDRAIGTAFERNGEVFALQLVPTARFPFQPDDELSILADNGVNGENQEADDSVGPQANSPSDDDAETQAGPEEGTPAPDQDGEETDEPAPEPEILFEGLARRLWPVPLDPENMIKLAVTEGLLYVQVHSDGASRLISLSISKTEPKLTDFAWHVTGFELSRDRKTLLIRQSIHDLGSFSDTVTLAPAKASLPPLKPNMQINIHDWRMLIEPREEWRQMLLDAWRLHREYSFDPDMRGLDWDGVLEKYLPFIDRIGHRQELNDLLERMIAELGLLHSQVGRGENRFNREEGSPGCLGAEFGRVPGGLKLTLIYRGEADRPETQGPLEGPQVDVREGDILKAVNGRAVASEADLSRALRSRAGEQVRLDLLRDGAEISVIVNPIMSWENAELRYQDWVEHRRTRVRSVSEGRIGYLHLESMLHSDLGTFARDFFEHVDKDGLIIDVRGNTGGNVSSALLNVLMRRVWAFRQWSLEGPARTIMPQTFRGHLAVLIDQSTYSDGENFAAGTKALDLGHLIGTRTAGAAIALTRSNSLVDGGVASIGESPKFDLEGQWLIEGHGVAPMIEVINPPVASFHGADAQLDAAIAYLTERMTQDPIPPLIAGPLPPFGEKGSDVL